MFKNFLLFSSFIFVLSCTIAPQNIAGSQRIQIRIWQNHTPDILAASIDDQFTLNIANERIVEFDSKVVGDAVYLVYTATNSVFTSKNPVNTLPTGGLIDLAASITPDNRIADVTITRNRSRIETTYRRLDQTTVPPTVSDPIIYTSTPVVESGVWVRVLKGTPSGTPTAPTFSWELLYAIEDPLPISSPKILPLSERPDTITAIMGNKVVVFGDPDRDGAVNYMANSTFDSQPFSDLRSLNTWQDGNNTFISVLANTGTLLTGYYQNSFWYQTFHSNLDFNGSDMQVVMARQRAYATIYDKSRNQTKVYTYDDNATGGVSRWLKIDSLDASVFAQVFARVFTDAQGIRQEHLFLGAPNQERDFFQLYQVRDNQTFFHGPIITEWNTRYTFAVNNLGQVLYARVNPNQQLIFAGLNSLALWENIQRTNPPQALASVDTPLQAFYFNGIYPVITYKQANGSIYVLGGAQ